MTSLRCVCDMCNTPTTITLTPPAPFINSNDRTHHHAKAKLTKTWRETTKAAAKGAPLFPSERRAHITFAIRWPDNRRRDVANVMPTAKAAVDGLVDAGVLVDDDDLHVVGPDLRRIRPNGTPLVVITITELED